MEKIYGFLKNKNYQLFVFAFFFLIYSSNSFGQGTACNGSPTPITVNGGCLTAGYNINDTTANAPATNGCSYNFRHEGWFTFTVSGGPMNIVATAQSGGGNLYLQLIGGTCGGTITQLACANSDTNNNSSQTETINYNNLANGTYYIRVVNAATNGGSMSLTSLCLTGTTPCNAPATVNTVTAITSTTATISWPAASPAPSVGYQWEVRTSGAGGSGATGLVASGSTAAGVTSANVTGLSASTIYYVYVRSNCGGSFSTWAGPRSFTTAAPAPANDNPCGAISLTTGTSCSTTTGTTVNATYTTGIPNPGCGFYQSTEPDVWFTAQVATNGTLQIDALITGSMPDPVIAVYSAASCSGPFTLIDCDDDGGPGLFLESQITLTGRTPGETLYIRVWEYQGNDNGTFSICASEVDPYCSSTSTSSTYYIEDFETTGGTTNITNNNSGYSTNGWGNFTSMNVTQNQSGTVNFTVDFSGNSETFGFNIWVDFNDDLDFNDAGELVFASGAYITGVTASFSIPSTAPLGSHRMRIRANYFSSNPSACGSISSGETEDYTLTVTPILCSDNPTNIQISSVTTDSANISWTAPSPAPGSGYAYYVSTSPSTPNFNDTPTGTTTGTSASISGLSDGTTYYVFVRSNCGGGNGLGAWQGPQSFTTGLLPPVTNDISVCQGNTGFLTATASCSSTSSLGNTINGNIDVANDPQADRIPVLTNNPVCQFQTGQTRSYTSIDFTVSTSGTYVFTMADNTVDLQGYIVTGNFTPGSCATGTWIVGDDDSGPTLFEPRLTATLTAGVIYTLITTTFGTSVNCSFTWNVSGPGSLTEVISSGAIDWYTAASGGTYLGSGSSFNPVGVAGSPISNTLTPGTWTFYAECSGNPGARTPAVFTIIQGPGGTLSGTPGCTDFTLNVDLVGTGPWTIKYSASGYGNTTVPGIATSPYQLTFDSSTYVAGTVITLTVVNDNSGCNAIAADISGSTTVSFGVGCACKTWTAGANSSDWFNNNNWNPVGYPTSSDCVIIPSASFDPEICGTCDANALDLTILNNGLLDIIAGGTLTVQNEVDINAGGTLELQSQNGAADGTSSSLSGSLIQVNNVTNTVNGTFTISRAAYVRTQDYVYWSSPVQNFPVGGISSTVHKYYWNPTDSSNPGEHGEWIRTTENMVAGKGYIVRGPVGNGNTDVTATWNTIPFNGPPNNGTILTPISRGNNITSSQPNPDPDLDVIEGEDDNWNLVGNPYPSTLDADLFLTTNTAANKITGSLWLWTHVQRIGQGNQNNPFYGSYTYNYDEADYMSYNGTMSDPPGWNGNIGSGQGFFVLMSDALSNSENLEFNNSMRITGAEQFLRTSNPIEKHRIWVDLVSLQTNQISTIGIGYVEGATNEFDNLYDAPLISGSTKKIFMPYTTTAVKKLCIQGRQLPFDINDQIPISVIIDHLGTYGLGVQHYDGLFDYDNQEVYVKDLELGITHNIKESPYYFTTSTTGVISDRFVIAYTDNSLSSEDFHLNSISISAPGSDYIKVSSKSEMIDSVVVYDLLGRVLIDNKDINAQEFVINEIPKSGGTYIVKAILLNGQEKIQKVVLK